MADSETKDHQVGTTAIPELNLPPQMNSIYDLRDLNKKMEEISLLRKQQIDRGMQKKNENEQVVT